MRFHRIMTAIVRNLPFGLARVIAPSFLGFVIINGFTFATDLLLLTAFHGGLHWPVPLSISLAYVLALGLSFVLNRSLNFHSHAPVGPQALLYALAIGVNYAVFILGVGSGLTALGVQYQISRLAAGACEGVFMYSVMRWVVFRDSQTSGEAQDTTSEGKPHA